MFSVRISTVLVALALVSACHTLPKPPLDTELQQIAEWEDRRSFGEGKLLTLALTAQRPAVRRRALLALGRIQDPAAADTLVKGLADAEPQARAEAAFSLGLLGLSWTPLSEELKARLTDALNTRESDEPELQVKLALLEALGRVGTPAAVERLVVRLTSTGDLQARAALSLGVAAKNGAALPDRAYAALALLLQRELPAARYSGAYALVQSKNAAAHTWLLQCGHDDASDVRAICAKGLGDVGTQVDAAALAKLLDDPDYRVAVEATRALAKLATRCTSSACPALGALRSLSSRGARLLRGDTAGGGQPLLALAQQGLPLAGRAVLVGLREQLLTGMRSVQDPKIRADVANLECRLAAALDKQTGTIQEVLHCGGGLVAEPSRLALALNELATAPAGVLSPRVSELGSFVLHADAKVKLAALHALGASKSESAMEKVRTQLSSADPVVAAAAGEAASLLGDRMAIAPLRAMAVRARSLPDLAPTVAEALSTLDAKEAIPELESWLGSTHATIRNAAAAALTKLKGMRVVAARVEGPVDPVEPPALPKDAKLLVQTSKGEFEVTLDSEQAPRTSNNLYTLARRGFFRGLTFHRVVPDFVVQGGDPRGDGEGGPGYTIRCEVNHLSYARGVVGMALGGKDTGGSQFFVTTAPQPHLDGRYTAFGEVTRGQEVVDSLLEGDSIVELRATP